MVEYRAQFFFCKNKMVKCLFFFLSCCQTANLKKEQEALQLKQQELEKIADQRRAVEQKRKESEIG